MKDHLGSIRAVINEDNEVVNAQDYDMWGFLMENRTYNIDEAKYKFTGKERDIESSYDYFGARYYVSRIGRWGSVDPLFEKHYDFSPYNYVLDNSLRLIDPNGKFVIPEHLIEYFKENYKKLYKMIKYDMEKLADPENEHIMKSLIKHTGLSRDEIVKNLKWGVGPQILVEDLCVDGKIRYGTSDLDADPDAIILDLKLIKKFESSKGKESDVYEFFISKVVITHEGVHIGSHYGGENIDYSKIDNPISLGYSFEKDAFGRKIDNLYRAVDYLNALNMKITGTSTKKYEYIKED